MRSYFSRRVPCPADAEDLVQRTLLASIDALPRFREDVALSWFVRAIASKLLLRHRRDRARARRRVDPDVRIDVVRDAEPSAFARVCHRSELHRLRLAFAQLSPERARLLQLRYWEERDITAIARQLELAPGTVRTRLHRARTELRNVLEAMDEAEQLGERPSARRCCEAPKKNSGNARRGRETMA